MAKTVITATYKGLDNSLGYRTGETYMLIISQYHNRIVRMDGTGACEYESIYAFLQNWKNIK